MRDQKKENLIKDMFSFIAPRYDLLNHLLSIGFDRYWRKVSVQELNLEKRGMYLDIAAGTGDISIEICKNVPDINVVGIDISKNMLTIAKKKITEYPINITTGNALFLPFKDETFNGSIVAFGIRNMTDIEAALKEMGRVVKKKGRIIILEFGVPENYIFKKLYLFYFKYILPMLGGVISGNRFAYKYLPESVVDFCSKDLLISKIESNGLKVIKCFSKTFGIVNIYVGLK